MRTIRREQLTVKLLKEKLEKLSGKKVLLRESDEVSWKETGGVLDHKKISDISLDGIDGRDYPDFADAYVDYGKYCGREMTELEIDELNNDRDFIYGEVESFLY